MTFPDSYPTPAIRYARTSDGRMVLQQQWRTGPASLSHHYEDRDGGMWVPDVPASYEWRDVDTADVPVVVVDATV